MRDPLTAVHTQVSAHWYLSSMLNYARFAAVIKTSPRGFGYCCCKNILHVNTFSRICFWMHSAHPNCGGGLKTKAQGPWPCVCACVCLCSRASAATAAAAGAGAGAGRLFIHVWPDAHMWTVHNAGAHIAAKTIGQSSGGIVNVWKRSKHQGGEWQRVVSAVQVPWR